MIVWKKDLTKSCWSVVHTKNMKSPEIQTYQLAPYKVKWREAITTNLKDLQVRESRIKWIKCESSLTAWAYSGLFPWRKVTGSVFTPPGSGILVHYMLTSSSLLMLIIFKKIITRVTHLTGAFIEMEVVIQGVMVFLTVMLLFSPQCRFYDIPQVLIQSL